MYLVDCTQVLRGDTHLEIEFDLYECLPHCTQVLQGDTHLDVEFGLYEYLHSTQYQTALRDTHLYRTRECATFVCKSFLLIHIVYTLHRDR